ncbi:hypothetical protein FRC01_002783 [Tulasnella sp. 417]|nr:hypothetical protein FRC01_002783 [Tulasnella sp. 417]
MGFRTVDTNPTTFASTPALLETIAQQSHQLVDLDVPLNTLSISWTPEPRTAVHQFKMLKALALDPLHIETKAMEPFARYLAQLSPDVKSFETIIFYPDETGRIAIPADLAEEELVESLFFEAQGRR